MNVFLNDETREMNGESTVGSLLDEIELNDLAGWAVAVNERVIARDDTTDYELSEGDRVVLVQATQGG
ncbi:MAG: sulfur carrier protein ThiS [Opitutae bacterium]|jgi:sulfur carrier protein|nr:sulfur carrier protein ThiS [Opitutae bacterium]